MKLIQVCYSRSQVPFCVVNAKLSLYRLFHAAHALPYKLRGMKKAYPKPLLTGEQVAAYLNVDKFTVYRLLAQRQLLRLKSATNGG